ncbi:MAG: phenylalanine--tRNA ligase subunit alpha [Desulfuromonadales bacterium]|nr:phenylalanine--tRNA ligase subunit alpha [Desulfuromonadales bacterium]
MKQRLEQLLTSAKQAISQAETESSLQGVRVAILGRKGELTALMKGMGSLSQEERPVIGSMVNRIKTEFEELFESRRVVLHEASLSARLSHESIDVTLPGRRSLQGSKHPITLVMEDISAIFAALGFGIAEGPEIERDFYNFEALNMPKDHPARDMQDTFYINEDLVLRTHTSPVQIRTMLKHEPPVRVIAPGTVYRCDSDITHSPMFHQVEGFLVDKHVTFGDLKGILTEFITRYFGADIGVRFRPSFFPFTEPSAEVDMQCVICGGSGCRVCKNSGWLEILGSGMIDPEVFKSVGYDSEKYSGFAFGMGVERIAMLKYGVNDLRLFFENDLRFLKQFN